MKTDEKGRPLTYWGGLDKSKKQTAVEWLIDELRNKHGLPIDLYSEFEQAKAMEEWQMIDFACDVYDLNYCKDKSFRNAAEQCYNETFKQEQ
jgi:hypothetical protein